MTSGTVEARTTDGEVVVDNSDSVLWSFTTSALSNLVPLVPLSVSSQFSIPGDLHYEQATSSATLNVHQRRGGLSRVFVLQSLDLVNRASEEAAAVPVVSKGEMGVRLRVRERIGV